MPEGEPIMNMVAIDRWESTSHLVRVQVIITWPGNGVKKRARPAARGGYTRR